MPSMSYCLFQNTASELDSCQSTLEGLINGDEKPLGNEELRAAKRLMKTCIAMAQLIEDALADGMIEDAPDSDIDLDDLEEHADAVIDAWQAAAKE